MEQADLEMLAESIEDAEEPAWMDIILTCKEQLDEEDDEYMELLVATLKSADIYWNQPWYQITNSLTRPLNKEGDYIEKYETGPMTKFERDLIDENWRTLVKQFDIPDKPLCLARWKNKNKCRKPDTPEERTRRFVTAFLAQGLKRPLHQVYNYIISSFGGTSRGPFTPAEEKIISVCFTHEPRKAVTILNKLLKREPRALYRRLDHILNGKPFRTRIKWHIDLAERLLRSLMKYTGLSVEELKNRKIEKDIWLKLENKFGQHYYNLSRFWQQSLHTQLFVKKSWNLRKLKIAILLKLKEFPSYQVWSDIRWKEVAKYFDDGFTPRFLYRLCYRVVHKDVLKSKTLDEVIAIGLQSLSTDSKYRRKRMRTLKFSHYGRLIEVKRRKDYVSDEQVDIDPSLP